MIMRKVLLTATLAATCWAGVAQAAMKPDDAIVARKAVMRVIGLNFGPLGAMVKGKVPFNQEVFKANTQRLKLVSEMPVEKYFPKGSETGKGTTVTQDVWNEWDEFEEGLKKWRMELSKLADVAQSGDEAAMRKQFAATAKTCKGCHDDFREKK
ncbi:MAG: cytochrome c [Gammaproteobacteria bacterium]|nr:MAG: cytochrome c [Gammaproteobacteria bacterium]